MKIYKKLFNEDNNQYYYIAGNLGMTSSGSFTKDKSRWIIFNSLEKEKFEINKIKPYSSTKNGIFININKF